MGAGSVAVASFDFTIVATAVSSAVSVRSALDVMTLAMASVSRSHFTAWSDRFRGVDHLSRGLLDQSLALLFFFPSARGIVVGLWPDVNNAELINAEMLV